MKVILLDIDGVLNCQEYFYPLNGTKGYDELDENKVKLLAEIVNATDAKIVLSSTWREMVDVGKDGHPHPIYMYLTDTLAKYGLSIISHTPIMGFERPLEIHTWLNETSYSIESFVILDDDFSADYYKPYGLDKHLVKTTFYGDGGLHPEHVERAIDILNGGD